MNTIYEKEESIQLINFGIGQELFGAIILTVREILRDVTLEDIQEIPDFIEGIVKLRGYDIPVVNLIRRINRKAKPLQTNQLNWVLIVNLKEDLTIGFIVDEVYQILKISSDAILPAPDIILTKQRSRYIRGVCKTEKGLLIVLDLAKVLLDDEIKAIKKMNIQSTAGSDVKTFNQA